jgi:signal-transduction protein with cAMP-binding, CBS, and nucleotidyltransferase domain
LVFFGRVTGEKKGIHQGKFNIKLNGLGPIIDAARLSALERKVYHIFARDRLQAGHPYAEDAQAEIR